MAGFVLRGFKGMRPILNPKLLDAAEAQEAVDVRLFSGAIEPVKTNETVVALKSAGTVQTIFRARATANETANWFEFSGDVDVALSPITQDEYGRIYWSGDGLPKYAPTVFAFASGSGPYPRNSYTLGIPKPTVAISAIGSAIQNPETQEREYIITFSNENGSKQSGPTDPVIVKALINYADIGTLYPLSFTSESATRYVIAFNKDHDLLVDDYIGITGSSVAGWNAAWKVVEVSNVKTVKIENTQSFPGSAPSGSYVVKRRYLPKVRLSNLPTDTNGNAAITHKRIYRKVSGAFKFVASIGVNDTEYTDTFSDTDLSSAATLADSIRNRPRRPLIAPNVLIPFDDTSIQDNLDSASPVAETSRAYAISYVTFAGVEGPLSKDSGVVSVVADVTKVRLSHVEEFGLEIDKKRIYRQNLTYTDGSYNLPEAGYRLVREVPASQDVFVDIYSQSSIAGNAAPAVIDGFDTPDGAFGAAATLPPKRLAENRVYVYTFVSEYGEEGPPSDPSTAIDIDPLEPVTVTTGGAPTGAFNITKKYIYRTASGSGETDYQFVGEQAVALTSFTDNIRQSNLGEVIPSIEWGSPPSNMFGLRVMANGIFVGFSGKDVCFSEPFLPHAWSPKNRLPVDHNIVGGGAFGQSVAILTDSYPYIATGIDPSAMTLVKTSLQQACISKRSIVETGDSVIYASPDGLVQLGLNGVNVLTSKVLSQEQWQEYNPSSIRAYLHEGRYYAFFTRADNTTGHLVFTLNGADAPVTLGTETTTAATVVPTADSLHIVNSGNIVMLDKGSSKKTYLWKSKIHESPTPINFGAAQVIAESYATAVTFKLYGDGALKHTHSVTDSKPFRLPSGYIARDWYVTVEGQVKITLVAVVQSITELKAI